MNSETNRSSYFWSVLLHSLDQLFSKSSFKNEWIHPINGFNVIQFAKTESGPDLIKAALDCSRKNNLIDEEITALSTCGNIIHPVGWPRHCVIGVSPINFKNDIAILNYCELNFEPITLSRVVKIPFSAEIFCEKTILQLLVKNLPSSSVKSNKFRNIFGEKGTFIAWVTSL